MVSSRLASPACFSLPVGSVLSSVTATSLFPSGPGGPLFGFRAADGQDGQVVRRGGVPAEGRQVLEAGPDQGLRAPLPPADQFSDPIVPVHSSGAVAGLGQA